MRTERLREVCEELGEIRQMSSGEIAREIGITPRLLRNMLTGRTSVRADTLAKAQQIRNREKDLAGNC